MITLRIAFVCFALTVLTCLTGSALAYDDNVVGIVLDMQGSGTSLENGAQKKLQLLTYLKRDSQINLEEGAKASLSLYSTRSVYRLTGPAVIDIGRDKVTVVKGSPAVVKSMAEKLVAAAETSKLLTGAIRMRQIPPRITVVTPENGAVLLNARPSFTWASSAASGFEVKLQEYGGEQIATEKRSSSDWTLAPEMNLKNGQEYRWTVTMISETDGKPYTAKGSFSIGSKEQIAAFENLKPSTDAPIEEWILYAATLQSSNVLHEAKIAWQNIAKQRPDLEKVQEMLR